MNYTTTTIIILQRRSRSLLLLQKPNNRNTILHHNHHHHHHQNHIQRHSQRYYHKHHDHHHHHRLTISQATHLIQTQTITATELASYCYNVASIGEGGDGILADDDDDDDDDDTAHGTENNTATATTQHPPSSNNNVTTSHRRRQQPLSSLRTTTTTTTTSSPSSPTSTNTPKPNIKLNAFTHLLPLKSILLQASESQNRILSGRPKSLLDGIPISLKSNLAVRELPLDAGSEILMPPMRLEQDDDDDDDDDDSDGGIGGGVVGGRRGCGYDSYVARRLLRESGAVLIGLTSMDEFGMGSLGTCIPRACDGGEEEEERGERYAVNPLPYMLPQQQHQHHSIHNNGHDDNDETHYWKHRIQSLHTPFTLPPPTPPTPPPHLSAGGSSCGSAISISTGSSLISIGTDTGGSIRLPSAWCGVTGFKPSYGRIGRWGVVSYASSLDTVGLVGPSVSCVGAVWDLLRVGGGGLEEEEEGGRGRVEEVGDSTVVFGEEKEEGEEEEDGGGGGGEERESLEGIRIGIPAAFSITECPQTVRRAWDYAIRVLEGSSNGCRAKGDRTGDCGATVQTVPTNILSPHTVRNCLPAYYVLACAEASSNLARYDGLRYGCDSPPPDGTAGGDGDDDDDDILFSNDPMENQYSRTRASKFGPEVIRRVLCGTAVLSSDRYDTHYGKAEGVRERMVREFDCAFFGSDGGSGNVKEEGGEGEWEGVDLMIVPTVMGPPPRLDSDNNNNDDDGVDTSCAELDSTEAFQNDVMTVPMSLAGLPCISVPVYEEDYRCDDDDDGDGDGDDDDAAKYNGVVGIQIFGPKLGEEIVLRAARVLEEERVRRRQQQRRRRRRLV